ncbi:MAG: outer membrane beta-barrel protein [Nitrospirae bacterium]|nr:outer membrane beta-barrel protein [Nitrospirota bacterium]MDE3051021.1 outer membrane beta-barrel protein [Nitrospirota bacterium]
MTRPVIWVSNSALIMFLAALALPAAALELPAPGDQPEHRMDGFGFRTAEQKVDTASSDWHYGGFVDLGYSLDFNFPANHLFRNRSTTPRVNELDLNMAGAYVRKDATEQSRWGMELMGHGGQDAKDFGFAVNEPKVGFSDQLRHFGRANLSYLAPVGNGLTIQGGLFNSFIGYDSLYAKDNINYTRPWGGDYTPYLMFGINVSYPFTTQMSGTFFVINEYFHLAHANDLPSYGGQLAYKVTSSLTVKETIYYGPDQAATSLEFWRLFSDSIVEWREGPFLIALDYQIGTEQMAATPGSPRAFWTNAALPMRWNFSGPWSLALRPELYWDRNGRMTGSEQFITAVTTTVEYRMPYRWTNTILRMEYRFDESRGPGGGFFKGGEIGPGVVGLTPAQHMLIFSAIWTVDSP